MRPLVGLLASLALACSPGGTGRGSAPDASAPCPSALPTAGQECSSLFPSSPKICCYEPAGGGYALSLPDAACSVVAFCPGGAGAVWDVQTAGDAGPFAEADVPTPPDGDADAGDAAEAGDVADATDATDAADVADTLDAADVLDAPDAPDATDATDAGDTSDGAGDVLLDVPLDLGDVLGG